MRYEVLLSCRNAAAPDLLDRIVMRLETIDGVRVIRARRIETMGMTARDAFFTVVLSVVGNFATDALRAAFDGDDGVAQVQVDDVAGMDDPPETPADPPRAALHRRDDDRCRNAGR